MNKVICGPVAGGKTTRLKKHYTQLLAQGIKSDNILVLLRSAADVSQWRKSLQAAACGTLHIYTYFGFVQNQIKKYWPLVTKKMPTAGQDLQPVFMTVESAHYLMGLLVEEARQQGMFAEVKSTSEHLALQLIDNLNQAAVNNISLEEAGRRLIQLGAASHSQEKATALAEGVTVMEKFRKQCLATLTLDYSLMIELFNRILMQDKIYLEHLAGQWQYLLVDDIEETVFAAQGLIRQLMDTCKGSTFAYNPQGGHTVFFGAYPEGVIRQILPRCEKEELGVDRAGDRFGQYLAGLIAGQKGPIENAAMLAGHISTGSRGEMLEEVAARVERLVVDGTNPGDLALVAPMVDKVMEFILTNKLQEKGIAIANVSRGKKLLDQPFAQAMVTLALLCNPQWERQINFSGLVQTLSLVLGIDPVRAGILAEEIFKNELVLPDIDNLKLLERVGFDNAERYRQLQGWVEERRQAGPDIELLFQQAFAELLSPLLQAEEDLLACRQVIDSAVKLRRVLASYRPGGEETLGYSFIDMVQRGTLAADVLYRPPVNTDKVILTTPLNLILNPHVAPVKYQIWLDVGSRGWLTGMAKELANPWVLSRRWKEGLLWDDATDQEVREAKLRLLVQGLLGKCSQGIYTAHSHLSSQGWEQESILVDVIETVQQGGGSQ
ncbi:UvrD-helicase domain-containing protein [Desulfofalx alkaliphila]|uniref:UvrD-helicase domain-containing protein n=1 Tax=Desulfofalx alkaliphila TaxID=105483 RepID=UPI0004E23D12|nr:UvrD-helicase domain-containing protein [Desulfofalx alkaliphila]